MNLNNEPPENSKILHTISMDIGLPHMKIQIDRALIDYNDEIEQKVSESMHSMINSFDLSQYIDSIAKSAIEHKFKQAIEYAINKKVAEMSSTISQAAHDIVNDRLGDE